MAYKSLYMQFRRVGILFRLYPASRTTSHIQFPRPDPAVWLRVINIHHHKNVISQVWFPIRFKLIFHAGVVALCVAEQTTLCRHT
jgi:hypothetical protein